MSRDPTSARKQDFTTKCVKSVKKLFRFIGNQRGDYQNELQVATQSKASCLTLLMFFELSLYFKFKFD